MKKKYYEIVVRYYLGLLSFSDYNERLSYHFETIPSEDEFTSLLFYSLAEISQSRDISIIGAPRFSMTYQISPRRLSLPSLFCKISKNVISSLGYVDVISDDCSFSIEEVKEHSISIYGGLEKHLTHPDSGMRKIIKERVKKL